MVAGKAHAQPGTQGAVDPPPAGTDNENWRPLREIRVGVADWVVTGAAGATVIGAAVVDPSGTHWHGGILADEDIRDGLRLSSQRARYAVRDMSDVGVSLMSTWPFLVDALITAWWYRGRADLARNMALVSAEAFGIAAALQGLGNQVGSRERPFGRLCGTEIPGESVDCEPGVRYRSFFSGHSTLTFVSAGLLCSHHLGIGLLGPTFDALTCATGFTVATMTSVFRIMSDMHYASDVGLGALVGGVTGLLVPWLHFGPEVRVAPVGQGLGLVGTF